jgi:putative glutamine amidotransferase
MAAATRPLIGINADFLAAGKQTRAVARLHAGYFDAVMAAGGLPVILPPLGSKNELDSLLDLLDGFVLSGGLDIDPRRLGRMTHQALKPMAVRREENDQILIKLLLQRRLPLLGIGLGAQQINVALGGNLFLHLPEDLPRSMPHLDPMGGSHRHIVLLEPGTLLEEIYGGGELRVNSSHHQAIREVADGLRIGAKAPDGVIEAVESEDADWFFVGVQWHPESETASALDQQLFESFVQACLRKNEPLTVAA